MSAKSSKSAIRSKRVQQMRDPISRFLHVDLGNEEKALRNRLGHLAQAAKEAVWRPEFKPAATQKRPQANLQSLGSALESIVTVGKNGRLYPKGTREAHV